MADCKQRNCKVCDRVHDSKCKYATFKCNRCNKIGHLERVCTKKECNHIEIDDNEDVWHVEKVVDVRTKRVNCNVNCSDVRNSTGRYEHKVKKAGYNTEHKSRDKETVVDWCKNNEFQIEVKINGTKLRCQVDTGAAISAISRSMYESKFKNLKINKDNMILKAYNESLFKPVGYFETEVEYNGKSREIRFYVVDKGGPCIVGRSWTEAFNVQLEMVNQITIPDKVKDIVNKYPDVFSNYIGKFTKTKINLLLKEDATPVFCKPRAVPLTFRALMDKELDKLEQEGIIAPIETSEWATPLVPILKKEGTLRLCGDYKVTVNRYFKEMQYPLPRVEEMFLEIFQT